MKPLETNQQILTFLCIFPTTNKCKRRIYIVLSVFLLVIEICGLASSATFVLNHISTDLEEAIYAIFQVAAFSGLIYMIIVTIILRNKIIDFFRTLSKICETSKI